MPKEISMRIIFTVLFTTLVFISNLTLLSQPLKEIPGVWMLKVQQVGGAGFEAQHKQVAAYAAQHGLALQHVFANSLRQPKLSTIAYWYQLSGVNGSELALIRKQKFVKSIEPRREANILYMPSDPGAANPGGGQLAHLLRMNAFLAWDSAKGDTNTVIGILDTGANWDQPDLLGVKKNFADPIDGIDNDRNGLVDDFRGYDLADLDNDPRSNTNVHGTNVTCIASATADNGIGIAGLGFKCKYLPIRIFGRAFRGYEAIVYAVDMGCDVINLSWGGTGYPSQFEQDVIDYAVKENGRVVIGAAGNTGQEQEFYPASYNGVVSVAFTELNDVKHSAATYTTSIDIVAAGNEVFGINQAGGYAIIGGGSSFAAPMVSALAGLLRSKYSNATPRQIEAMMRGNADLIDTMPANRTFRGKIGSGRMNMAKAVTRANRYFVDVDSLIFDAPNDAKFKAGQQVGLRLKTTNVLDAVSGVTVTATAYDTAIQVLQSTWALGALAANASKDQPVGQAFRFAVSPFARKGKKVVIGFEFKQAGVVVSTIYRQFEINRSWLELSNGTVSLTIGASGRFGYIDEVNEIGTGFSHLGRVTLGEGGLMLASDSLHVPNCVASLTLKNNDFAAVSEPTLVVDDARMKKVETVFRDTTRAQKIGLDIKLEGYVFKADSIARSVVLQYTFSKGDTGLVRKLYSGLLLNWDLDNYNRNKTEWDSARGYSYTYSDNTYAAAVPLGPKPGGTDAIDVWPNIAGNTEVTDADGYSRLDKFRSISRGLKKKTAGLWNANGTNVVAIISQESDSISATSKQQVAFGLVTGATLDELDQEVASLQLRYRQLKQSPTWLGADTVYACNGFPAALSAPSGIRWEYRNTAGQLLGTGPEYRMPALRNQSMAFTITNKDSLYPGPTRTIVVAWQGPSAAFSSPDSVNISRGNTVVVRRRGSGRTTYTLAQNGSIVDSISSISDSVVLRLPADGLYTISAKAVDNRGCSDTISKPLVAYLGVGTGQKAVLEGISLQPNPATDVLHISGKQPIGTLVCYGLDGRALTLPTTRLGAKQIDLDVNRLPAGYYLLIIDGQKRLHFVK